MKTVKLFHTGNIVPRIQLGDRERQQDTKIKKQFLSLNLKVCHPRCVRSIIQSCSVYIYIYLIHKS